MKKITSRSDSSMTTDKVQVDEELMQDLDTAAADVEDALNSLYAIQIDDIKGVVALPRTVQQLMTHSIDSLRNVQRVLERAEQRAEVVSDVS